MDQGDDQQHIEQEEHHHRYSDDRAEAGRFGTPGKRSSGCFARSSRGDFGSSLAAAQSPSPSRPDSPEQTRARDTRRPTTGKLPVPGQVQGPVYKLRQFLGKGDMRAPAYSPDGSGRSAAGRA